MNRYEKPFFNGITTLRQRRPKRKVKLRRKYLREPAPMKAHTWVPDYIIASAYSNIVLPISGLLVNASAFGGMGATMVKHVHLTAVVNSIKEGESPFKK